MEIGDRIAIVGDEHAGADALADEDRHHLRPKLLSQRDPLRLRLEHGVLGTSGLCEAKQREDSKDGGPNPTRRRDCHDNFSSSLANTSVGQGYIRR